MAQQVRTFTERVEEGAQLAAMRASIAKADRIVFLGFAFHRQNVELLSQVSQDHTEIVATAFGISLSDRSVIEDEISKAFHQKPIIRDSRISLADMPCSRFFTEYWRTLTADKGEHEVFDYDDLKPTMPTFPSWQGFRLP